MTDLGFSTNDIDRDFDPKLDSVGGAPAKLFPDGEYEFLAVGASVRESENANGQLSTLNIQWTCQGGPMDGQTFWDGLMIRHSNPEAKYQGVVEREKKMLRKIATLNNKEIKTDADVMMCRARIHLKSEASKKIDPRTGEFYPTRNKVVNYLPPMGATAKAPTSATSSATTPPAPSKDRPW